MQIVRRYVLTVAAGAWAQWHHCCGVGLLGFFIGADLAGASVIDIVDRWQQLIGGVLAILAALMTIKKMAATDADLARRHREQINLQLRSDALTINRAWTHTVSIGFMAREISSLLIELKREYPELNGYGGLLKRGDGLPIPEPYRFPLVFLGEKIRKLLVILTVDEVVAAQHLFDGAMNSAWKIACDELSYFDEEFSIEGDISAARIFVSKETVSCMTVMQKAATGALWAADFASLLSTLHESYAKFIILPD